MPFPWSPHLSSSSSDSFLLPPLFLLLYFYHLLSPIICLFFPSLLFLQLSAPCFIFQHVFNILVIFLGFHTQHMFFFSLLISITRTCFSAYFQLPEKPFSISVFSYGIEHVLFILGERGCCCLRVCRLNGGLFLKVHLTIHSSDQHLIGQIMS